jgi:hypothetical protein
MSDPLSVAASIAGLVSLAEMIASRGYKYYKEAKGASDEVKKLLDRITDLFGVLNSLWLVTLRYEGEDFDSTMQVQHIHSCYMLLEGMKTKLEKADPRRLEDHKSITRRKAASLGKYMMWPFSHSETKTLVLEVENHKSTLSLALAADGM